MRCGMLNVVLKSIQSSSSKGRLGRAGRGIIPEMPRLPLTRDTVEVRYPSKRVFNKVRISRLKDQGICILQKFDS